MSKPLSLEDQTKLLLRRYQIFPQHKEGQNFLIDDKVLEKIIKMANLEKDDLVLEIGAGLGVLTQEIAKRARRVVAVEKDQKLIKVLRGVLAPYKNVEVISGDILKIANPISFFAENKRSEYKIVANLPYNITSIVLRKFLAKEPRPKEMILMVQKEVAERVMAKGGKMSLLALSVQFYAQSEILFLVSRESFYPQPEVESAVLRIVPFDGESQEREKDEENYPPILLLKKNQLEEKNFFQLIKIGFSSRRKQLQNNLAAGFKKPKEEIKMILEEVGLDRRIRPEDLSLSDWISLLKKLNL